MTQVHLVGALALLCALWRLNPAAAEIIIVDESPETLERMFAANHIGWKLDHSIPRELQYGSRLILDKTADFLAGKLAQGNRAEKFRAAQTLWKGRCRKYAANVLAYVQTPTENKFFLTFKDQIEADLKPEAILEKLKSRDPRWGAWLAGLRPHADFVPSLIAALNEQKDYRAEFLVALGRQKDPRALVPLTEYLRHRDGLLSGYAAFAIGELNEPGGEAPLIAELNHPSHWTQINICYGLGKIGTARSLPELEKLAISKAEYGVLHIPSSAQRAIEQIKERERKP